MARYQLTEVMIQSSFEKTGVDEKYFPIYDKIAKRYFEDLSNEGSDQDEQTEDDNYAVSSLNLADEYLSDYVREAERGHCEQWCDIVADESDDDFNKRYCIAYNSIENEEGREKELRIHANSLSEDPVYVERYIYLFKVLDNNPQIRAKEYATTYHKCIEDGRSQNYAHGYAYAVSEYHYLEPFCHIFAEAYETAKEQGRNDDEAISMGRALINKEKNKQ